mgnify:CR=1 FL=1
MIVDCHTHIWESVEQLGRGTGLWDARQRALSADMPPNASVEEHLAACGPVDWSLVLAFQSRYLDAEVPNDFVARYVRQHPDRMIGIACVDPSRPKEAVDEVTRAHDELGMKGITLSPAAQNFHPADSAAMRVYTQVARLRMPLIFHQAVHASATSKMEFARPCLIDEVAREFPDLKIVVSHLGYPWAEETIALLGKHANVFADISGMMHSPWRAYNVLLSAYQAGVMGLLLFGSNFPYGTAAAGIEALYSINQFCHGTSLPTIPREQLRRIVERDALELLGIDYERPVEPPRTKVITSHTDE